jgi:predicted nucleic acid-binding protein
VILILDSSPLITLARIAKLPLLQSLANQIVIPSGVYQEMVSTGKDRPGALSVQTATWLVKKTPTDVSALDRLAQRLGRGETEAIVLAKELPDSIVELDDALARRVAREEKVPDVGTVGLLIHAKHRGLLSSIKPILQDLKQAGFYLDQSLINLVLQKTDESPQGPVTQ